VSQLQGRVAEKRLALWNSEHSCKLHRWRNAAMVYLGKTSATLQSTAAFCLVLGLGDDRKFVVCAPQ
jgi:hypothetical protein